MVLGVDGGPCVPESTPKFYATCEFKFKDIADVMLRHYAELK